MRLHTEVVKALDRAQHRSVFFAGCRHALGQNNFQQQLMTRGAHGLPQFQHFFFLFQPQSIGIVGVVMQQALHHLLGRPMGQRRADGARAVKTQGARTGQLHRTPHPPAAPGGAGQGIAPIIAAVDQHAGMALQMVAALHLFGCANQQFFEQGYARLGGPAGAGQFQKLAAVVKGHHTHIAPLRPRDRHAVQLRQRLVGVHLRVAAAAKPVFQFCGCGHGRRAGVARNHDGTAGVGHARGVGPAFALQQAAQQAR